MSSLETREKFAKEMWGKFSERNVYLKQVDSRDLPEKQKEEVREKIIKNFESQMAEIKSMPGYQEANDSHIAVIQSKIAYEKAQRQRQKLDEEYQEKMKQVGMELSKRQQDYEDAKKFYFGDENQVDIDSDQSISEDDDDSENNEDVFEDNEDDLKNSEIVIEEYDRYERIKSKKAEIIKKIKELQENGADEQLIEIYEKQLDRIELFEEDQLKCLYLDLQNIRDKIKASSLGGESERNYFEWLKSKEAEIIAKIYQLGGDVQERENIEFREQKQYLNDVPTHGTIYEEEIENGKTLVDSEGHTYYSDSEGKLHTAGVTRFNTDLNRVNPTMHRERYDGDDFNPHKVIVKGKNSVDKIGYDETFCGGKYCRVKRLNKWGFIDNQGKEKLGLKYDFIKPMWGGYIVIKDKKVGYLDSDINFVLKPEYKNIKKIYGGFLVNNDGKFGIFNGEGREIVKVEYDDIQYLDELLLYKAKKGGKYYYFDFFGNEINPDIIIKEDNSDYQENNQKENINEDDNQSIKKQYDAEIEFGRWNLLQVRKGDKFGLIDKEGNIILDTEYDAISNLVNHGGCVWVRKSNKWGIFHGIGKTIDLKYDNLWMFAVAQNHAMVGIGKKMGIISKGKEIIDPIYDNIKFSNGVYLVQKDSKSWILDTEGREITKLVYDEIVELNGVYKVRNGSKRGLINSTGEEILKIEYDCILKGIKGYKVKKLNKWGVIDEQGKEILEIKYDVMNEYNKESNDGRYFTKIGNKVFIFDKDGTPIFDSKHRL